MLILNDVMDALEVAHIKLIGVTLGAKPLQSRYTTNLTKKLSCPTQIQVISDPIRWDAFAMLMVVRHKRTSNTKPDFFILFPSFSNSKIHKISVLYSK